MCCFIIARYRCWKFWGSVQLEWTAIQIRMQKWSEASKQQHLDYHQITVEQHSVHDNWISTRLAFCSKWLNTNKDWVKTNVVRVEKTIENKNAWLRLQFSTHIHYEKQGVESRLWHHCLQKYSIILFIEEQSRRDVVFFTLPIPQNLCLRVDGSRSFCTKFMLVLIGPVKYKEIFIKALWSATNLYHTDVWNRQQMHFLKTNNLHSICRLICQSCYLSQTEFMKISLTIFLTTSHSCWWRWPKVISYMPLWNKLNHHFKDNQMLFGKSPTWIFLEQFYKE